MEILQAGSLKCLLLGLRFTSLIDIVFASNLCLLNCLGKLEYFTSLNSSAIWGWFLLFTMIPSDGRSEVVII